MYSKSAFARIRNTKPWTIAFGLVENQLSPICKTCIKEYPFDFLIASFLHVIVHHFYEVILWTGLKLSGVDLCEQINWLGSIRVNICLIFHHWFFLDFVQIIWPRVHGIQKCGVSFPSSLYPSAELMPLCHRDRGKGLRISGRLA